MIEFYRKHFETNYKAKVKQLITDISRLLEFEKISEIQTTQYSLDEYFKHNLSDSTWKKVNILYDTLNKSKTKLSPTLSKFINKTESFDNSKLTFIDTFAGCGGLSLGLMNNGFKPILINEIEPKFLETYYFNHNIKLENYHCGDIKEIAEKKDFREVDLVVGGPPCQGFSMANRQRILDDPRNKLYSYYLQLLASTRPKFFIMENVKGMMNKSNEILDNFKETLGNDYTIEITLLNAKNFGIPQNRERVFVIGSRVKNAPALGIVSDLLKTQDNFKKKHLKDALFGLPELEPKRMKNTRGVENDKIGYKFRKNGFAQNEFIENINNSVHVDYLTNHTNRFNNDRDIEIFDRLPQGANSLHSSIKDIMPYSSRNNMFKDKYYKLEENKVSKTITSHMRLNCNMYIHPTQPRGLSPREASRIQTFPDDYVFMGANNTWYAQIGNAVPVKLAEIIGNKLLNI